MQYLRFNFTATGLLLVSLLLSGCAADKSQYQANTPALSPMAFFEGPLCAWGTVHDFNGDVSRRFVATINASTSQQSGVNQFQLDEQFLFDDGERQHRLWQFTQQGQTWVGTAGDVDGQATAQIFGNMMHLEYVLIVTQDDDQIRLNMDDRLHLINENNMLGKTIMSKFGINVGEINIMLQKQSDGFQQCQLTTITGA